MWPIIFVAAGGAIGACLRYGISSAIAQKWASNLPLGTLLVNVSGCLLVAYFLVKGIESGALSSEWKLFFVVGLGGAYTTFSTFSFETVVLLREGLYWMALCNVCANLFLCILASFVGVMLAKIS